MKYLIAVLAGVILLTGYVISTFNFQPSGLYNEENIERIRRGEPKLYQISAPRLVLDHAKIEQEVACLSKNIYFEARDQSTDAQLAVAWVTLNRVYSRYYPNEVCDVVYQGVHRNGVPVRHKCKFSWYCDGRPDRISNNVVEQRAWKAIQKMTRQFVEGCLHKHGRCPVDNTNGALYYYNPDKVNRTPSFAIAYDFAARIEDHLFFARN